MELFLGLAAVWRARAADLREWGAEGPAKAFDACADELEVAAGEANAEVLTLSEAAAVSGYSKRRIRELIADGSVPNAGRKGAPRVRHADLPRKAQAGEAIGYDLERDAQRVVRRMASSGI